MRRLFAFLLVIVVAGKLEGDAKLEWKPLAPGLEIASFKAKHPAPQGDSTITVLRIDPSNWNLEFAGAGADEDRFSVRDWCSRLGFTAAINAGMFRQSDDRHVGYARFRDHLNSRRITSYQSVAAFDPRRSGLPSFHIFDLDSARTTIPAILKDYGSAVQNLRLIQRPGVNKWRQDDKKASETALGEDEAGRILFIFARSPFSMFEMNQELLSAGIGLVAAQYLEGGPEAQLYIHVGKTELEMFGSYETAFQEDDKNPESWPIPNVLGIRPRIWTTK
jgi:Phosphodiester glycosidase